MSCGEWHASTHVEFSTGIAESLIKSLISYGNDILKYPHNVEIRGEIMWASHLAMDRSLFMGRKGDWSCHQISHEVGALLDIPHAEILSALYPAWLKYVSTRSPILIERLLNTLWGTDSIAAGLDCFRDMITRWGLPLSLPKQPYEFNQTIADRCMLINESKTIGNYWRLNHSDISSIITSITPEIEPQGLYQ